MIYPTNTSSDAPETWLLNETWRERTLNWEDVDSDGKGTHITERSITDNRIKSYKR
jgi:hypothetical protein